MQDEDVGRVGDAPLDRLRESYLNHKLVVFLFFFNDSLYFIFLCNEDGTNPRKAAIGSAALSFFLLAFCL